MIDRLPPHSPESEQGIIGCILLSGKDSIDQCHEKFNGKPEVFYDLRHREIFMAAESLVSAGIPVDLITMQERLKLAGLLDQIGGLEYLSRCQDAVPSAANLEYYTAPVLECFIYREIVRRCTEAVTRIYEGPDNMGQELDRLETEILGIRQFSKKDNGMKMMKELVREALGVIEGYHQAQGKLIGLSTGLSGLNRITCGLQDGEMIIIAARPSLGKTSLAMQIAEHVAISEGHSVGVFSLEMSGLSLVLRAICSRAMLSLRRVKDGMLLEEDFPKITTATVPLSKAVIAIDDTTSLTIETLRAKARRMAQRHNIRLLVIDYIQLMQASRRSNNREGAIAEISRGVKCLAKELRIPVIALSQLNRDIEKTPNRKPTLSDLRESGALEQDADIVAMLYRLPLPKDAVEPEKIPTNLLIAKHRNGPTGEVKLMFHKSHTRFYDEARVDAQDIPYNQPHAD